MAFLNVQDAAFVRKRFEDELASDVTLEFFTPSIGGLALPGQDAEMAEYARQILTEVAALSPRITLNVHSMASDPEAAARFGVARTPATAIIGAVDYGVRFYGMPAGYEFATLLELILDVAKAQPPLSEATKTTLGRLKDEAHIQVFVTPT
jgi:alkyl hydroperoxide reductase subunit AhpF